MTASSEVPPFVLIERVAYTPRGTFGRLVIRDPGKGGNLLELWTVERPWLDNQARISCIPEGTYGLVPSRFYRGGYDAPEIRPVAGRSRILIHVGNTMDDVEVCVAVGLGLGVVRGQWAVTASQQAHANLMAALAGRSGTVAVYQGPPAIMETR